jgi:uncharacterized protein (TIGR02118 family)
MICVSAFYPAAGESRFDHNYYRERHLPLVKELLTPHGLTRVEVDEGLSGFAPGSPANYLVVCRMYFGNLDAFLKAVNEVGGQIFADVPNYTDIPVELQVSRVSEL